MVALPNARPVTTPVLLTVAVVGAVLLQVPPVLVSASVILPLRHTVEGPVMGPVPGVGITVTRAVSRDEPQLFTKS